MKESLLLFIISGFIFSCHEKVDKQAINVTTILIYEIQTTTHPFLLFVILSFLL